jgi:hypothetical protein
VGADKQINCTGLVITSLQSLIICGAPDGLVPAARGVTQGSTSGPFFFTSMFYFGAKLVVFLADRVINARAGESRRSHPQQINQDDFFLRKKNNLHNTPLAYEYRNYQTRQEINLLRCKNLRSLVDFPA